MRQGYPKKYRRTEKNMNSIEAKLFELQDKNYQQFHTRIVSNLPPEQIIGVRTPALRALAKSLSGTAEAAAFLQVLPHRYFEENQLHSFLISMEKDMDAAISAVNTFLPYVDNWATCDQLSPAAFKKNPEQLLPQISVWLADSHTYTIRFGIEMLMNHFLDGRFQADYLRMCAAVQSEEYYVNMMLAWYFATALAKQWDAAIPYLQERRLSTWVHKKTVQKAVESYRIPTERKVYLRTLK